MTTTIERFTQWARLHLQSQYNALMGMLSNPVELLECFENQPGNKACGIDKISKSDYADGVVERIKALSANLRSLSYQPKPSRRVYIPKGNGKSRPIRHTVQLPGRDLHPLEFATLPSRNQDLPPTSRPRELRRSSLRLRILQMDSTSASNAATRGSRRSIVPRQKSGPSNAASRC